jgi:5'-AMP-activated protein kinase regulatory gamma subunit
MVQYKFIVDGEWRHDEQQAHMVDTNGNVNNWLLVTKQPHHILPPTSDPVTLGATMDVDHDMLHHIGSGAEEHHHHHHHHPQQQQHHLSRALMAESGATIVTAAEAEASKKNIMDFLLHHSAYELLPESGKVVALDVTLPVKQAFHALYEQVPAISAVPFHSTRFLDCAPTIVHHAFVRS